MPEIVILLFKLISLSSLLVVCYPIFLGLVAPDNPDCGVSQ
jgi:hypothetical protein